MRKKLDKEYFEFQSKLNLSEIYNNEEIKLLKKNIPEMNNLIYLVSNNELNNANNSKCNEKINVQQYQYRYFSPTRKIKNNSNSSFLIDKEKFYSLILNSIQQYFEQKQNFLFSKSISLIMDEILNVSKIIKQNLIYDNFFKSIKNTKLISYSTNKNKNMKNIKNKFSSSGIIINTKNNIMINRNNNTNEKFKKYQNETDININHNDNSNVKKHLSFKSENRMKKNNKNSKSLYEDVYQKEKHNNKKGNLVVKDMSESYSISKRNQSIISMKNKIKENSQINKKNKTMNLYKRNLTSMNNSSTQVKTNKKFNKTSLIGLKKTHIENNKKMALNELINNKNDYNLVAQNNKKNAKDKLKDKSEKSDIHNNNIKKISPSKIDSNLYKDIETQKFNIFKLEKKIGRENILPLIGYYVFNYFGFDEIIKYNKFEKWCQKISDGYIRKNYYHNDLHAADITQTCLIYFKMGEFEKVHEFSKSNICSIFLSCICHDYQHPGVNNNFLKETNNKLSIRYNDTSILENMHISSTFKLILNNKNYNIFENVDKILYKQMRKEMISCVLATDMAFHNQYVEFLKKCINERKEENKEKKDENKNSEDHQKYMNLLIHSADISNPTKLFDIYFEWAKMVVEEFWDQGDKEKKLNLTCTCDREKVTIYQSQLGFINFIEIPYFSLFAELDPKLKFLYDNLLNNKNTLLSMQAKEKEKENEKDKEK